MAQKYTFYLNYRTQCALFTLKIDIFASSYMKNNAEG